MLNKTEIKKILNVTGLIDSSFYISINKRNLEYTITMENSPIIPYYKVKNALRRKYDVINISDDKAKIRLKITSKQQLDKQLN